MLGQNFCLYTESMKTVRETIYVYFNLVTFSVQNASGIFVYFNYNVQESYSHIHLANSLLSDPGINKIDL